MSHPNSHSKEEKNKAEESQVWPERDEQQERLPRQVIKWLIRSRIVKNRVVNKQTNKIRLADGRIKLFNVAQSGGVRFLISFQRLIEMWFGAA